MFHGRPRGQSHLASAEAEASAVACHCVPQCKGLRIAGPRQWIEATAGGQQRAIESPPVRAGKRASRLPHTGFSGGPLTGCLWLIQDDTDLAPLVSAYLRMLGRHCRQRLCMNPSTSLQAARMSTNHRSHRSLVRRDTSELGCDFLTYSQQLPTRSSNNLI